MAEPTKAYLATSGEYSSYAVQRVFLDKALADKYLADGLCDEIEEFEITTTETRAVSILHTSWESAHTRPYGLIPEGESPSWEHREEYTGQPACTHQVQHRGDHPSWGAHTKVIVQGHDHVRVRKVLAEQVAKVKAELAEPGAGRD